MAGCGKPYNAEHKVEGASLRCGTNLYWKTGESERARTQETILCAECKEKECLALK